MHRAGAHDASMMAVLPAWRRHESSTASGTNFPSGSAKSRVRIVSDFVAMAVRRSVSGSLERVELAFQASVQGAMTAVLFQPTTSSCEFVGSFSIRTLPTPLAPPNFKLTRYPTLLWLPSARLARQTSVDHRRRQRHWCGDGGTLGGGRRARGHSRSRC